MGVLIVAQLVVKATRRRLTERIKPDMNKFSLLDSHTIPIEPNYLYDCVIDHLFFTFRVTKCFDRIRIKIHKPAVSKGRIGLRYNPIHPVAQDAHSVVQEVPFMSDLDTL